MSDHFDRVRAINQRWLATMGLDDESQALLAELRERVSALRRQYGARPPWWRPIARARWGRWMARVEERVLSSMRAELLHELRAKGITVEQVEAYMLLVFPEHVSRSYLPGRPVAIPGDAYVAALSHERFHEWFGTTCDWRCPHRVDELPVARIARSRVGQ